MKADLHLLLDNAGEPWLCACGCQLIGCPACGEARCFHCDPLCGGGYGDEAHDCAYAASPAEPLVVEQPERVPCPDCNGTGKVASTVPGVPASVCVRYTSCERCWPKDESGQRKPWDDGTAGTIPAPQVEQRAPKPTGGMLDAWLPAPVEPETDR